MFQIKLLARSLVIILLSFTGLIVDSNYYFAFAEPTVSEPLGIPQNDPLLPANNINRELSPLEKKRVEAKIESLEIDAKNQLQQGNQKQAFLLWFRQLRLYRAIDLLQEIKALGRVGERAWQNNKRAELRVISRRLHLIEQDEKNRDNSTAQLLNSLGESYQKIRDLDKAIAVYRDLLAISQQENNLQLEQQYLEILGELYLDKFNYVQGGLIYEKLVSINSSDFLEKNIDRQQKQLQYLVKLRLIYDRTTEFEKAITVKKQLISFYTDREDLAQIVKIKLSLANDYQSLDKTKLAIKAYRETATIGLQLQQIALASEALQKLGYLYEQQRQYSLAIQTYQELLGIEKKSYNSYGVMNSYDLLGKIYFLLEDYNRALDAFSSGLEVAQSLNYRVSYFTNLIGQVNTKIQ